MRTLILCLLLSQIASAEPLDTFIAQKMDEAGIAGIGAAVIVDKKVVFMKGYGFADKERGVPFRPDTVMNIGSISKTFTGVALMRAVQEGKLSLDEDINMYLPFKVINPHLPNEEITLRYLATHTSGITDRRSAFRETYHFGDKQKALGEGLKDYLVPGQKNYSKDNFLNKKPGTHREYTNFGAALAGYIVEIAVGENLERYAKKHIFIPLRMNDTAWSLSAIDPAKHSKLYWSYSGGWVTTPVSLYEFTTYPSGGVRTSIADLSKFFIALLNDGMYEGTRILEKRTVDEMLRFQYTDTNMPANIDVQKDPKNSGIFWSTKFNVTRIGHGGSDPGVKTDMLANLTKDVGVILFSNTSTGDDEIQHYVAIFKELFKYGEALKGAK